MGRFFLSIFRGIGKLIRALFRFLGWFLGIPSWGPPPWLRFLYSGLRQLLSHFYSFYRSWRTRHASLFWTVHVLLFLSISTGLAAYIWYQSQPKPLIYTFHGKNPLLSKLDEEGKLCVYPTEIIFSDSVARIEQVGKEVTEGIEISPLIAGTWYWDTDRVLRFTPDDDWGIDQEYVVHFDRNLFPEHILLETYEHRFQSVPFRAKVSRAEFYQDPKDPRIKKVVATVRFSHSVNTEAFEKHITLRMAEQSKGFLGIGAEFFDSTVSYNKFENEAYIHSATIPIPLKDTYLELALSKGILAARGPPGTDEEIIKTVNIPGMFNFFKVNSTSLTYVRNAQYEPEQLLIVQLTDGVLSSEVQKNIEVYVLPKDKPALQGQERVENYRWGNLEEIGTEILQASARLDLEPVPTEREYETLHSFKYRAESRQFLYLRLRRGIKSYGGYILAEEFDKILRVPRIPKEVTVLHEGAILSLGGAKTLSVLSRDVRALQFEVGRVLPDQINHLISQSEGDFESPSFSSYEFSKDNITERYTEIRELAPADPRKAQYSSFSFTDYLKKKSSARHGLFFLRVSSWDVKGRHRTGAYDSRFILITNLGVLVKGSLSGTHDIFIQAIDSGKPVSGATVEVIGKNGLPVISGKTDRDGHVQFPSLKDFKREKEPTVYIVRKGRDLSFLPFGRKDRRLNLSRFDIGGEYTADDIADQLDASLFSDRGIYRPGETFHIGIIVKPSNWQTDLSGIPLEVVVSDARGLQVKKQKIRLSEAGFEEVQYQTEETAPTGSYRVDVYVVKDEKERDFLGSTNVRVEEFLPDKLKISSHLSKERIHGWVSPDELKGLVTLKNLFGTPAANRDIAAYLTLSTYWETFRLPEYKDYTFFDPFKAEKNFSEQLETQKTDENGETEFTLDLNRFDKATYRLIFTAEGYASKGGRSVVSQNSVLVSPLQYLLGYKSDGDLSYLNKESERTVTLIAVGPSLEPRSVSKLQAELIELRYVSVLTKQPNNTFKYESVQKDISISKEPMTISKKGFAYRLPTKEAGDFALLIRDEEGTELQRVRFSVIGKTNLTRSLERNAELQIKLNKGDFASGEDIELQIRSPYVGAGLITIERDQVYAYKWFRTKTTSSVETIRVPEDLEGNAYVNVSFVRGLDSGEIFMSPLSYGVVPFTLSREKRINRITLNTPDVARPGEPFTIGYAAERPAKIVVYAIDEGILQVARYKIPDPLAHFFRKRALEVDTTQILDLILPEFSAPGAPSAPGGDGDADTFGKNLNPFKRKRLKSVVFWSGIIDTTEEEQSLTYEVPDYFNGTLHVMAVAVSKDDIGVNHKKSLIRSDIVLSPNAPTFVAPGDIFDVSLDVTNLIEGSGDNAAITVDVKTSEQLSVVGVARQELTIPEEKEATLLFKIKANDILGSGTFTFAASRGDKKATYTIDLSVRPPTPFMTTVTSGMVTSGKRNVPLTRDMYPEYRTLEAAASNVPLGLIHGLTNYLEKFPYGCTEQIVSQAIPALVLRNRPKFDYPPEKVESNLKRAMYILQARQNSEGAFGFWAANSHVSNFQTVYALHFLTESRERNYPVPRSLINRGLPYLRKITQLEIASLEDARTQAYAHYVLTRNGKITTNSLSELVDELGEKYPQTWKADLTGLYLAATYKLLKKEKEAQALINKVARGKQVQSNYDYFYDRLTHDGQYLYIVSRHFPERIPDLIGESIAEILQPIFNGSYNTLSTAYLILALDTYLDAVGEIQPSNVTIQEVLLDGKARALELSEGTFSATPFSEQAKEIRFTSEADQPIFYQVTEAGFDRSLPTEDIKEKLEVYREYRNEKGNIIDTVAVGSRVAVHLKFRSIREGGFHNVAIVDLLPGGFEVDVERTRDNKSTEDNDGPAKESESEFGWEPDYIDIREDRMVLYGFVGSAIQEYVYHIQATNVGDFSVPPTFGESMYDRHVQARSKGGTFQVVGRE